MAIRVPRYRAPARRASRRAWPTSAWCTRCSRWCAGHSAAGLVTRRPHPTDARLVRVHLTERGRHLQKVIAEEMRRLSLNEVPEAIRSLQAGQVRGKLVITV
jgi:hypothetical protein